MSADGWPPSLPVQFLPECFLLFPAPTSSTVICFAFPFEAAIALINFSTFCRSDTVMHGVNLIPRLGLLILLLIVSLIIFATREAVVFSLSLAKLARKCSDSSARNDLWSQSMVVLQSSPQDASTLLVALCFLATVLWNSAIAGCTISSYLISSNSSSLVKPRSVHEFSASTNSCATLITAFLQ